MSYYSETRVCANCGADIVRADTDEGWVYLWAVDIPDDDTDPLVCPSPSASVTAAAPLPIHEPF